MDRDLFLSFEGRIPRSKWWLGVIVVAIAAIVANIVILGIFGAGTVGSLLSFIVGIVALYPILALGTKRLADRGYPPMPRLAIFYGLPFLSYLLNTFNIGYRPVEIPEFSGEVREILQILQIGNILDDVDAMQPNWFVGLIGFLSFIAFIWAIVALGFIRGDTGNNRYGPPTI